MIENLGSATSAFLWQHNGDEEDGHERVRGMLDRPPWIRWTLHSYHYPNQQAEAEGRPSNRIRSFSCRGEFELSGCTDITNSTLFTSHPLCMMSFEKSKEWRDEQASEAYVSNFRSHLLIFCQILLGNFARLRCRHLKGRCCERASPPRGI